MKENDIERKLLSRLLLMTKSLVNILNEGESQGLNLRKVIFRLRKEIFSAESEIKAEQNGMIEELFSPTSKSNSIKSIVQIELKLDSPKLLFLN